MLSLGGKSRTGFGGKSTSVGIASCFLVFGVRRRLSGFGPASFVFRRCFIIAPQRHCQCGLLELTPINRHSVCRGEIRSNEYFSDNSYISEGSPLREFELLQGCPDGRFAASVLPQIPWPFDAFRRFQPRCCPAAC